MSMRTSPGTAVVTGASSGIGAVYAERLAGEGHDLVLVARRAERLEDLAERLRKSAGVAVEPLVADLSLQDDVARVAERVAAEDVTLLVNNAGINGYGPYPETDPALLAKVLAVNVVALTALTRAALPGMLARGRGAVVNVASLLAFAGSLPPGPLPYRAVYGGTKREAKLEGAVKQAALAIGRQALHAAELEFPHPLTGKRIQVEAPLPDDFSRALSLLRRAL